MSTVLEKEEEEGMQEEPRLIVMWHVVQYVAGVPYPVETWMPIYSAPAL
jgi:hypothetical protein